MFRIKICGVTQVNDAMDAVNAGADAIGLNFYKQSSRFIDTRAARAIAQAVRQGRAVKLVGVFVNATVDYIADLVRECELDAIQLHGDESDSFAWQVADRTGVPIIRAFALQKVGAESVVEFCGLPEAKKHLAGVLIDSALPGQFGGTGVTADWGMVADLVKELESSEIPVILAGGLNPDNVGMAIKTTGAAGVDVASGVESAPGIKLKDAIVRFVSTARDHLQGDGSDSF